MLVTSLLVVTELMLRVPAVERALPIIRTYLHEPGAVVRLEALERVQQQYGHVDVLCVGSSVVVATSARWCSTRCSRVVRLTNRSASMPACPACGPTRCGSTSTIYGSPRRTRTRRAGDSLRRVVSVRARARLLGHREQSRRSGLGGGHHNRADQGMAVCPPPFVPVPRHVAVVADALPQRTSLAGYRR
jgi:hypothetical protein